MDSTTSVKPIGEATDSRATWIKPNQLKKARSRRPLDITLVAALMLVLLMSLISAALVIMVNTETNVGANDLNKIVGFHDSRRTGDSRLSAGESWALQGDREYPRVSMSRSE